jgi:hypothetical protein
MFSLNLTGTSRLPTTIHDYLPWKLYDWIPKADLGLHIPFLKSPFHCPNYTAWHVKLHDYKHTLKFEMLKAI